MLFGFLNMVTFASFIITIWTLGDNTVRDGLAPRDVAALPSVIFLLLYAFYLIECFCAATRHYLSIVKRESAMAYIDVIRQQPPMIAFKATGWHYEQKLRSVPYRDARGKLRERIESYQERVETFSGPETFSFTNGSTPSRCPKAWKTTA